MKKSEIKDLYNQSDAALMRLKYITLLLPYSTDQVIATNTMEAAAMAAELLKPVKVMCDYMIDDGSTDMTERLLNIKAEVVNIQKSVLKMAIADSDEAFELIQNCQAIKNTIKDMEEWTANDVKPQQTTPETPLQPNEGNDEELAGNNNKTQPEGNNYIELPPELQTTDQKAEKIFTAAYNNGWIIDDVGGGYKWVGFGNISITRKLAYLCAKAYETPSWKDIEQFFGKNQLARDWSNIKSGNIQSWMNRINDLIAKALK